MNISKILIVSPLHTELQTYIEKANVKKNFRFLPEAKLTKEDVNWADALVCFHLKSDIDYSQVKWVHSLGAGVDRFLSGENWNEGVLLTRTICSFGQRIAEYCLSYILKDLQFHDQFRDDKKKKSWHPVTPRLLSDQKVMIYGTGEIGQMTAKTLTQLGVEVYGVSLSGEEKAGFKEVSTIDAHYSRLPEMSFIINTLPLTKQTTHIFNENIFNRLKQIGFINVGRGGSLDENALLHALNQKQVRFAVLDVFTHEPLPENSPLWNHPHVNITPHISAVTTAEEAASCFIETLSNIEENKPLKNRVDIQKGY